MNIARQKVRQLQLTLEAVPIPLATVSRSEEKIVYMNHSWIEFTGYRAEEFLSVWDWVCTAFPELSHRAQLAEELKAHLTGCSGEGTCIPRTELRLRCKDGSTRVVLCPLTLLPDHRFSLITFVDRTPLWEKERAAEKVRRLEREAHFVSTLLLEQSQEMTLINVDEGTRRAVSPGVLNVTGFTAEEFLTRDLAEMIHIDDRLLYLDALQKALAEAAPQQIHYRGLQKDGSYCWSEATIRSYCDPVTWSVRGWVANVRNISRQQAYSEKMAAEVARLAELAGKDELTGIPNRRSFNKALLAETRRQSRSPEPLALLLLDVDTFKGYNDQYGHLEGDICLRRIAQVLQATLRRATDTVARFGGEEFVILLPHTDEKGAHKLARDILNAIRALQIPYAGSKHGCVTASIGAAYCSSMHPLGPGKLLDHADRALYAAKMAGRNVYNFTDCSCHE